MIKLLKINTDKDKAFFGMFICFILTLIGYILLKFVSTLEKPPLGQTVYIIFGTLFMAVGGVGILTTIRYIYSTNKKKKRKELKRKKHKIFFLKKESENKKLQ